MEPFGKISAYSFHIFLVSILSKQNENLVGSPQTGRTDFIKYLSAHCGRFVVTIPSLESVSLEVVTRVFSGVASSASWAIFLNIDKLNKNVFFTHNRLFVSSQPELQYEHGKGCHQPSPNPIQYSITRFLHNDSWRKIKHPSESEILDIESRYINPRGACHD